MSTKAGFIAALGGGTVVLSEQAISSVDNTSNQITLVGHGRQTGDGPFRLKPGPTYSDQLPTGLHPQKAGNVRWSLAGVGSDGDTLRVGGRLYTKVASIAADGDYRVVNAFEGPNALMDAINGDGDGISTFASATANEAVVALHTGSNTFTDLRAKNPGIHGNTLRAVVTSATDTVNNSGEFSGGTDAIDYWIIRVDDDTIQLATSQGNAIAETAVTFSNNGGGSFSLELTVQELADRVENILVNHLTRPGNRVQPSEHNIQLLWAAMVDAVS